MPKARANIRAKFSAQIDTGATLVARTSAPAATSRPAIVNISGRPAATRLPNATTKMTMVTGQERTSERNMALRFAVLNCDHKALSPVNSTLTADVDSFESGLASESAARTIVFGPAAAPPVITAVRPSAERLVPGWGASTVDTRLSARNTDSTRSIT